MPARPVWVVVLVLLAAALAPSAAAADPNLYLGLSPAAYIGKPPEYAVAFKAEEGRLYVIELAGTAQCYFTEPFEELGTAGFSSFAAPVLMHAEGSEGLIADDGAGFLHGSGTARVQAELGPAGVSGTYSYERGELSYHCSAGFSLGEASFTAAPYAPIGTPGVAAPSALELPAYYGSEGSVELFLRAPGSTVAGIRGTFVPACRVERSGKVPSRQALFLRPASAELGADGSFRHQAKASGETRSGARYTETATITGALGETSVSGTYRRVRTVKPKHGEPRRCITGPLPVSAARYLPAAG